MFEVEIDTKAVNKLLAQLSLEQINRRGNAAMLEATAYLKGEVQKATPVDRGIGRGSVATDLRGRGADITGRVFSAEAHMTVLELGRRPGAKPPPLEPIRTWLSRHGKDPKLAYVVARAIGKRGTKPIHMFKNAADKGRGTVNSIFLRHFRF